MTRGKSTSPFCLAARSAAIKTHAAARILLEVGKPFEEMAEHNARLLLGSVMSKAFNVANALEISFGNSNHGLVRKVYSAATRILGDVTVPAAEKTCRQCV